MRKYLIFLIALASIAFGVCSPASAQFVTLGCQGGQCGGSGGGGPTFTGQTTASNASCGFVTSCSATATVTGGLLVVVVGGLNQSGATSSISSVTTSGSCGSVTLTAAVNPTVAANGTLAGVFYGTVSSGSCTIQATASATGAFQAMALAVGTLNGLTSNTPGTGCSNFYNNAGVNPFACSSSITVSSGGLEIVGTTGSGGETFTAGNYTMDAQVEVAEAAAGIGHVSMAGSITPNFTTGDDFDNVGIVGAPWR